LEYNYEYDQLKPIGFAMHDEIDGFFFNGFCGWIQLTTTHK